MFDFRMLIQNSSATELYGLKNEAANPFSSLNESIDTIFIENDPIVFEFIEDKERKK